MCHSFLRTKKSPDISSGHYNSSRTKAILGYFKGIPLLNHQQFGVDQPAVTWSQIQGTSGMSFALPAKEDWNRAPPGISGGKAEEILSSAQLGIDLWLKDS